MNVVLAMLGVMSLLVVIQLVFETSDTRWHLLRWFLAGIATLLLISRNDFTWQHWVVSWFGVWGGALLFQSLYSVLLVGADLLLLIIQRNTQRRR
jgi:hypothetical protein